MKLKTILLVASLAVGAAFGQAVVGANECGVMRVDSTTANTIIAVPWVEVDSGDAIKVANLVMTDSLTAGDQLFVYDNGNWFAFQLSASKAWEAFTTVAGNGIPAATGAQDKALPQGTALFLKRSNVNAPIYLYGQVATTGSKTATAGTAESPAFTLIASPKAEAFDLNASGKVTGAGAGDLVLIPQDGGASIVYTFKNGQWGRNVKQNVDIGGFSFTEDVWSTTAVIPMGIGFWYVSNGGEPVFNW